MTNPPFAPDNPRTRQASFRKCSAWYGSIEDNCVGSPAAVAGFAARTSVTLFTTATVVGAFPFVQDRRLLVLDLAVDPRRRGCSMLCPPLLLCVRSWLAFCTPRTACCSCSELIPAASAPRAGSDPCPHGPGGGSSLYRKA